MLFELDVETSLGWVGAVFNAFKPLLFVIGGISIGFFILENIINIVREKMEERETARETEREKMEYIQKRIQKRWEKRRAEIVLPEVQEI